jgi:hypothetical protein
MRLRDEEENGRWGEWEMGRMGDGENRRWGECENEKMRKQSETLNKKQLNR